MSHVYQFANNHGKSGEVVAGGFHSDYFQQEAGSIFAGVVTNRWAKALHFCVRGMNEQNYPSKYTMLHDPNTDLNDLLLLRMDN